MQSGPHLAPPVPRAKLAPLHRVAPAEACQPRPVCDTYEPRRHDPFTAPPGAVPFPTYLEALNDAATLRRALEHKAAMNAASVASLEPAFATSRPETPRIGDVPPTPAEAPEAPPHERRTITTREVATGRIFDAVF